MSSSKQQHPERSGGRTPDPADQALLPSGEPYARPTIPAGCGRSDQRGLAPAAQPATASPQPAFTKATMGGPGRARVRHRQAWPRMGDNPRGPIQAAARFPTGHLDPATPNARPPHRAPAGRPQATQGTPVAEASTASTSTTTVWRSTPTSLTRPQPRSRGAKLPLANRASLSMVEVPLPSNWPAPGRAARADRTGRMITVGDVHRKRLPCPHVHGQDINGPPDTDRRSHRVVTGRHGRHRQRSHQVPRAAS